MTAKREGREKQENMRQRDKIKTYVKRERKGKKN